MTSNPRPEELLPPAAADRALGVRLTKSEETSIINRPARSTDPKEKFVLRSGATPTSDTTPVRITVFTPTYNRARTLRRVFESLCRQSHQCVEWLVVDDGSTDETPALLDDMSRSAGFPIHIIRQPNGGKHRAHNAAIKVAQGELTVVLDSDDELAPEALEILTAEWNSIPLNERSSFGGILGHSALPEGGIVGSRFHAQHVDGKYFELMATGSIVGDKLPCYRTDVLREFPFPERHGCNAVVPESTVWLKIGALYRVRCIDRVVLINHSDKNDPLSLMNSYKGPESNAWGSMLYFLVVLSFVDEYWPRFFVLFAKAAVNCTRFALHSGSAWFQPFVPLDGLFSRALRVAGFPLGVMVWGADRVRSWVRNRS
jgi:glycosyltransferase involved in cell wall biosynthesis